MPSTIHRLPEEGLTPSIDWLCAHFSVDRRLAALLLWDVAFKIGTDRHHWIVEEHARRFIDSMQTISV